MGRSVVMSLLTWKYEVEGFKKTDGLKRELGCERNLLTYNIKGKFLDKIKKLLFYADPELSKITTLLGGSGGVVNSLDFCPASLKSLSYFYFRCVLSS